MSLTTSEREQFVRTWGTVLMRSWEDSDYQARLNADPRSVLAEAGLQLRDGATVALEAPPADAGPDLDRQIDLYAAGHDSGSYVFYVQDPSVRTQEISEQELEGIAAGACCCSSIISCCCCT